MIFLSIPEDKCIVWTPKLSPFLPNCDKLTLIEDYFFCISGNALKCHSFLPGDADMTEEECKATDKFCSKVTLDGGEYDEFCGDSCGIL